jgi:predicted Zn finger-like uncharacterized protein
MILTCPACQTRYTVDAAKFPPQGRSVRCARCGEVWHAEPDVAEPAFEPPPPEPPRPDPREAYAEPVPRDPVLRDPVLRDPVLRDSGPQAPPVSVREPSPPFWQRRPVLAAGWVGLVGVVLLIGIAATAWRQQVVDAWPQSAAVYSKLGMKVAASGLKLDHTKFSNEMRGALPVLTVSGALTNVADRELPVPQIRIGLVDAEKREVYHWTVAPNVISLKPGQSTRFATELSNPPEGAIRYEVRFAKAGE